jgi:hypothetical protein
MLTLFKVRNWMPSAELIKRVDTLFSENQQLFHSTQAKADSLAKLRQNSGIIGFRYIVDSDSAVTYRRLNKRLDSLERENAKLKSDLKNASIIVNNAHIVPASKIDTLFMDKINYINSYKVMKAKFDNDLKKCRQEGEEYRSKYNILLHQTQDLMDRVRSEQN